MDTNIHIATILLTSSDEQFKKQESYYIMNKITHFLNSAKKLTHNSNIHHFGIFLRSILFIQGLAPQIL